MFLTLSIFDSKHNDAQHEGIQHIVVQYTDTQHTNTQNNYTKNKGTRLILNLATLSFRILIAFAESYLTIKFLC